MSDYPATEKINASIIDVIAKACHEINRAYCLSLGDTSQEPWGTAPKWAKASARNGVVAHLENPDMTPEESHNAWLADKEADGWTYGDVKDVEKKTHPCFRPYHELPLEQRSKDYLFKATVAVVADILRNRSRA